MFCPIPLRRAQHWKAVLFCRTKFVIAVFMILLLPSVAVGDKRNGLSSHSILHPACSYRETSGFSSSSENGTFHSVALPDDDLFRPLLADPKEPRFSGSFQRVRFRDIDDSVNASAVGFGGTFGLWGLRHEKNCNGLQVNLFGAVFSQFNLDAPSSDLINSDFQFGLPVTFRHGPFSARLRIFHQSSHVGDEFLLNNPDFDRVNLSFEMVEAVISLHNRWGRLYGGGGYIYNRNPKFEQGVAKWGLELRGSPIGSPLLGYLMEGLQVAPVFGSDFNSVEELGWNINMNFLGGLEWSRRESNRRLRLLLGYYRGRNPYGQFFDQRIESYNINLQIEL